MDKNGSLKSAKRIYKQAEKEYLQAKKTKNEMKARQAAEKGYLCLVQTVNALLEEKGVKPEELPKTERGRRVMLGKFADREWRKSYDAIRHIFHINTFYEGIVVYKDLKERFEDLQDLIRRVEDGKGK